MLVKLNIKKSTTYNLPSTTYKNGFTLIELLVSISIVGLIFGIVITSSVAIQKNSRNTRREADLQIIQGALQQYFADQFVYPEASFNLSIATKLDGATGNPPVSSGQTYLPTDTVPKDPVTSNSPYCYRPLTSGGAEPCLNSAANFQDRCNKYELYTQLEDSSLPSKGTCNGKSYNREVTP